MSIASAWHMWNTLTAPSTEELLWHVATFQAPLRDLQIHGLILCMLLGISIYTFPPLFGLPQIAHRRAFSVWLLIVLSLVAEITLFLAYRLTGNHYYAAALLVPWSLFLTGILLLLQKWKLWKGFEDNHPTHIFIKTSYGFLVISFLMLLLLPVYQSLSGIAFSHAYYGAIRHAITVGFATLLLMGLSIRLIPHAGNNPYLHRITYLIICLGCSLRVSLQILTDWNSSAYSFIGISGVLEVIALTLWGSSLAKKIYQNKNKFKMEILKCL